jgi:hypothetical protein
MATERRSDLGGDEECKANLGKNTLKRPNCFQILQSSLKPLVDSKVLEGIEFRFSSYIPNDGKGERIT